MLNSILINIWIFSFSVIGYLKMLWGTRGRGRQRMCGKSSVQDSLFGLFLQCSGESFTEKGWVTVLLANPSWATQKFPVYFTQAKRLSCVTAVPLLSCSHCTKSLQPAAQAYFAGFQHCPGPTFKCSCCIAWQPLSATLRWQEML